MAGVGHVGAALDRLDAANGAKAHAEILREALK
jgi:hypothetical protein